MDKKFLDFIAALCMTYDVDWSRDFDDDEYCLDNRPVVVTAAKRPAVKQPAVVAGRAG